MSETKVAKPWLEPADARNFTVGGVLVGSDGGLISGAASAAARELAEHWNSCIAHGGSSVEEVREKFLASDVEGVCAALRAWAEELLTKKRAEVRR